MQSAIQAPLHEAPLLSRVQIRSLLDAARRVGELEGRLVELATLCPTPITSTAAAPLELLDRENGFLRMIGRHGFWVEVAVSPFVVEAIDAAAAGRSFGPVVPSGPGDPVIAAEFIENNAIRLINSQAPECEVFSWSFEAIRRSISTHLLTAGAPLDVVVAQAGEGQPLMDRVARDRMIPMQASAASMWPGFLGLWRRPGGSEDFHDKRRRGLRGIAIEDLMMWTSVS